MPRLPARVEFLRIPMWWATVEGPSDPRLRRAAEELWLAVHRRRADYNEPTPDIFEGLSWKDVRRLLGGTRYEKTARQHLEKLAGLDVLDWIEHPDGLVSIFCPDPVEHQRGHYCRDANPLRD